MPQLGPLPWVLSFVMGVFPFIMVLVLSCKEGEKLNVKGEEGGMVSKVEW